jgi:hypothetical protein
MGNSQSGDQKKGAAESVESSLQRFGKEQEELLEAMARFQAQAAYSERKIGHIRRILANKGLPLARVLAEINQLRPTAMDIMVLLESRAELEERMAREKQEAVERQVESGRLGGSATKLPKTKAFALREAQKFVGAHDRPQWAGTIANSIKRSVIAYSRRTDVSENLSEETQTLKKWIQDSNLRQRRYDERG